jgi:hypothetical protein
MRARGRMVAPLLQRRRPRLRTTMRRRSYPSGYSLEELGPQVSPPGVGAMPPQA